jgi:hypothetical protein
MMEKAPSYICGGEDQKSFSQLFAKATCDIPKTNGLPRLAVTDPTGAGN